MKVLLVEPDRKLAETYKRFFESEEHEVSWAAHAQDAVSLCDQQTPDLIVLELRLAGHNGIEFLYELRSYAEWQSIPVVVLTMISPHALAITAETMAALGIVRCLYKPATNLRQLRTVVSEQTAVQI